MPSGEVTTRGIVEDALRRGKKVFVPYLYKENVDGETKVSVMDMVSLKSEDDYHSLRADRWGIPIPDPASMTNRSSSLGNNGEEHGIGRLDMIVMPGVAFDRERRRLGHGKGYYDFFLHRYQIRLDSETRDEDTLESRRMPFLGESPLGPIKHHWPPNLYCSVGLALYEQLLPEGQAIPITTSDYALDALIVGDGSFYEKEDRQTPPA
ncbi:hypothetical protein MMC13_007258 [Lambiella insularis]|nr:hypothetical protein [Lambiella insularis]